MQTAWIVYDHIVYACSQSISQRCLVPLASGHVQAPVHLEAIALSAWSVHTLTQMMNMHGIVHVLLRRYPLPQCYGLCSELSVCELLLGSNPLQLL